MSTQFIYTPSEETITIPRTEYDSLVVTTKNHAILCRHLLDISIQDPMIIEALDACLGTQPPPVDPEVPPTREQNEDPDNGRDPRIDSGSNADHSASCSPSSGGISSSPSIDPTTRYGIYPFPPPRPQAPSPERQQAVYRPYVAEQDSAQSYEANVPDEVSSDTPDEAVDNHRLPHDHHPSRSVQLANLPENVTYADVLAIVRGGMVFEVLIPRTSTAVVSFVEHAAAAAYFKHVHNNGLFIKNKRVEITWCDRNQVLRSYLSQRIASGTTRNIVIRKCSPEHTEASIRADLEHIHNLNIIRIEYKNGDCHISTNSVANAMYARTCMMSRLSYRSFRIDWDIDECAQPLDQIPLMAYRRGPLPVAPLRQPVVRAINRFQLLLGEEEGEEAEDDEE